MDRILTAAHSGLFLARLVLRQLPWSLRKVIINTKSLRFATLGVICSQDMMILAVLADAMKDIVRLQSASRVQRS